MINIRCFIISILHLKKEAFMILKKSIMLLLAFDNIIINI